MRIGICGKMKQIKKPSSVNPVQKECVVFSIALRPYGFVMSISSNHSIAKGRSTLTINICISKLEEYFKSDFFGNVRPVSSQSIRYETNDYRRRVRREFNKQLNSMNHFWAFRTEAANCCEIECIMDARHMCQKKKSVINLWCNNKCLVLNID